MGDGRVRAPLRDLDASQIRRRIRGLTADECVAVRQAETKPILEAFKTWLMQRLEEQSAKSNFCEAIRYTLNHWDGMLVFLTDGRVEVDNNVVERTIRPIYLTDVLERIVSGQTKVNALPELLPWNWKAARTAQMDAAA
jgi:transposase